MSSISIMTTIYRGEYIEYNGTPIIANQFTISILSSSAFNSLSVSDFYGASANSILGPEQIVLVGSNDGYGWVGLSIFSGLTSIWAYLLSYNLSPTITFTVNNTQAYRYYRLLCLSLSPQTFSNNPSNSSVALSGWTLMDVNKVPYTVSTTPYLKLSSYLSSNGILAYNGTTSVSAYTAPTSINPSISYQGEYFEYSESSPFILGKMLLGIARPADFNQIVSNTINTGIYNATPSSILGPDQIVILASNDGNTWTGISSESNLTTAWASIVASPNSIPTITISTTNTTPYLYYRIVFPRLCFQSFTTTDNSYNNAGIVLTNLGFMDNNTSVIYPIYPQSTTIPFGSSLTYLQYNNYPSNGTVRLYNGLTTTLASFAPITSTAFVTNIENTPTTPPPSPTTPSPTTPSGSTSPTTPPPSPITPGPTTAPIVFPTSPPISTPPPSPTTTPTQPGTPPPSPTTTPTQPGTITPSPTTTPTQPGTIVSGPTNAPTAPLLPPALVTQLAIGLIILSIIGLVIILLIKNK